MSTTLEIQEKLNNLLSDTEKLVENISTKYREQTDLVGKLSNSTKNMFESIDVTKVTNLSEHFEKASDSATQTGTKISDAMNNSMGSVSMFGNTMQGANRNVQDFAPAVAGAVGGTKNFAMAIQVAGTVASGVGTVVTGIAGGIATAFEFVTGSIMSLIGAIGGSGGSGGLISSFFKLAQAIILFPFKILDFFIKKASQGGGPSELAVALEKVRQEFGYLNKTAGGMIYDLTKNLTKELANTGLSVRRVFGSMAERIDYFLEYAKNLGETVDAVFKNLSASSAESLGAFNKALGFTAAGQKGVAQRAVATGRDINEINREIANYSIQLSEAFGVTMKSVSRDVGEMMADFEHFGSLSVKEMTQAAVFARRLGIEVKSLGKLVDKFLNFEDAANSASQLSQAFGMNIDAFKLMNEQDPAKKLQMLRDGFFATGRTIENMNAQERRLLATQTGLGESELALAFSQKSRSLTYDQIKKKGDSAQKSQLTQAQALEKLANAIERLNKGGGGMEGGFLDRFIQGFLLGIQRTREFRDLIRALARSLNIVFRAGIEVGQMFVKYFPGVRDFLVGLRKIFDPRVMLRFMNRVKAAFKEFFQTLTTNPASAFPILLQKLQEAFLGRFSETGPGGRQMLNGIRKFIKAMAYILFSGIRVAILTLAKTIIPLIKSFFTGGEVNLDAAFQGPIGQFISGIIKDVTKAFQDVLGDQKIQDALKIIGDELWAALQWLGDWLWAKLEIFARWAMEKLEWAFNWLKNYLNKIKFWDRLAAWLNCQIDNAIKAFEDYINSPEFQKRIQDITAKITEYAIKAIGAGIRQSFRSGVPGIIYGMVFGDEEEQKRAQGSANRIQGTISGIGRGIYAAVRGTSSATQGAAEGVAQAATATESANIQMQNSMQNTANTAAQASRNIQESYQLSADSANQSSRNIQEVYQNTATEAETAAMRIEESFNNTQINTNALNQVEKLTSRMERQVKDSTRTMNNNLSNALTQTPAAEASATTERSSSITEQVSNIRETLNSASQINRVDQKRAKAALDKLKAFAESMGPKLAEVQTAFDQSFQNINLDKINDSLGDIKSLFNTIKEIKNLLLQRISPIAERDFRPFIGSLDAIKAFATSPKLAGISSALESNNANDKINKVKEAVDSIKSLGAELIETKKNIVNQAIIITSRNFTPLNNSISAINGFMTSDQLTRFAQQLTSAETAAKISGIQTTANSIIDMVKTINATSEELAKIDPINIQSNLKHLGTNLGLGNNAAYTISNKNFTVTVNVDVHMDSKDLEKVMLENKSTRIQHTTG